MEPQPPGVRKPTQPDHAITKTVKGVPVGFALVRGRREYFVFGVTVTWVVQELGRRVWDGSRVIRLLAGLMVPLVDSTIRCYRSIGARAKNPLVELSDDQIKKLESLAELNPVIDPWGLPKRDKPPPKKKPRPKQPAGR